MIACLMDIEDRVKNNNNQKPLEDIALIRKFQGCNTGRSLNPRIFNILLLIVND